MSDAMVGERASSLAKACGPGLDNGALVDAAGHQGPTIVASMAASGSVTIGGPRLTTPAVEAEGLGPASAMRRVGETPAAGGGGETLTLPEGIDGRCDSREGATIFVVRRT
jgi:hypothetical protein